MRGAGCGVRGGGAADAAPNYIWGMCADEGDPVESMQYDKENFRERNYM